VSKVNTTLQGVPVYSPQQLAELLIRQKFSNLIYLNTQDTNIAAEITAKLYLNPIEIPIPKEKEHKEMQFTFKKAVNGFKLYKKLKKKHPNSPIFVCPAKSGDTYVLEVFLRPYFANKGIKNPVFTVIGEACAETLRMIDFYNIEKISWKESLELIAFKNLTDKFVPDLEILHFTRGRVRASIMPMMQKAFTMDLIAAYRRSVYDLNDDVPLDKPVFAESQNEKIADVISKYKITKGKSVILAPYANSFPDDSVIKFFEKIAFEITKKGYKVFTNSIGDAEPAIKGTEPINFKLANSVGVLEYAGHFIGLRSGFCDIISSARCKKIVLYSHSWPGGKRHGEYFEFHSLNRMGISDDAIELLYGSDGGMALTNNILAYL
jgi:hypothetical protein